MQCSLSKTRVRLCSLFRILYVPWSGGREEVGMGCGSHLIAQVSAVGNILCKTQWIVCSSRRSITHIVPHLSFTSPSCSSYMYFTLQQTVLSFISLYLSLSHVPLPPAPCIFISRPSLVFLPLGGLISLALLHAP